MQDIRTADWSSAVSPFWQAVIQSAFSAKGVTGLLRAGWTTIKVRMQLTSTLDGASMCPAANYSTSACCRGDSGVCCLQGALVMPLMARGLSTVRCCIYAFLSKGIASASTCL